MKPEQLTAWALHEATQEERARIEAQLADDAALREQAESLKHFCATLEQELAARDDGGLTTHQRAELERSLQPVLKKPRPPVIAASSGGAKQGLPRVAVLAACLMLGLFVLYRTSPQSSRQPSETIGIVMAQKANEATKDKELQELGDLASAASPLAKQVAASSVTLPEYPAPEIPQQPVSPIPVTGTPSIVALKSGSGGLVMNGGKNTYTGGTATGTTAAVSVVNPSSQTSQRKGESNSGPFKRLFRRNDGLNAPAYAGVVVSPSAKASTARPELDKLDRAAIVEADGFVDRDTPALRIAGERYQPLVENPFSEVSQAPLSTFSIDVDTAAYANVRRFLNQGVLPPADAIRLEEMINYFPYAYEPPTGDQPFSVQVDVAEAPWKPEHRLARIAIKGREIGRERKQANFVFLVDVSGSMSDANKLPLVKQSLHLLADQLADGDRVALVTYAGSSGVALESTNDKAKLRSAIEALNSGGSTNGASGIQLAYEQAQEHFIKEGINRVLLCTDGDFNVGVSSPQELEKLIKDKAQGGVFLSVLGYGTGNLQDYTMETLADKGNGNYAYIDSLGEARKVLVEQMQGTLVTIAKDVKIQVEFNPAQVASYRLIGYENRLLAKEDFNNDRKDAGEIGAGHTVTALYEIVPVGVTNPDGRPVVDGLKYQQPATPAAPAAEPASSETMTVKLRYKQPEGSTSQLIEVPVKDGGKKLAESPKDFQFATSVVGFGLLLRQSASAGNLTWEGIRQMALNSKGEDPLGYRGEFLQLIDKARGLSGVK